MKIRYYSDVHLEFGGPSLPLAANAGEDVVVMAGDIECATLGIEFAINALSDRPVIYVLGIHEFYGQDWDDLIVRCRKLAKGTNVHFLENDAIIIDGIRFLGCTLWTDFLALGHRMQQHCINYAERFMSDYQLIHRGPDKNRVISPWHTIDRFIDSVAWLEAQLVDSTIPTVVVTHHAPTKAVQNPQFAHSASSAAFHSELDHLIRPPVRAWIYGHSHYSCKAVVNEVPVVSNQRGYPDERDGSDFDPKAIIEVHGEQV